MGIVDNALAGASGNQGYFLTRSLRFRSSASAFLNRTPASAGNQKVWTWSAWIKRGSLTTGQWLFAGGVVSTDYTLIRFGSGGNNNDNLEYVRVVGSAIDAQKISAAVYRDPSAWYHIVVTEDAANTVSRVYVNGSEITYSTNDNPSNVNGAVNAAVIHNIGRYTGSNIQLFDGYMAEVNLIDGQALTPSSFGMNDPATGVWEPKKYTGTYGTNGFYLPFTDNSAATATTIGRDFSGNGNNWTPNNISVTAGATYDSMTDVPTLTSPTAANYCVINPLSSRSGAGTALSNANLTQSGTSDKIFAGTIASTSGKFYYEYVVEGTTGAPTIGVADVNTYNMTTGPGETSDSWSIWLQTGLTRNNATDGYSLGGFSIGNILQVAWDVNSGKVWFGKNNTWGNSGNPATDTNPAFTNLTGKNISPVFKQYASGSFNFGQRPFAYTPPSGFVALNTFNLPTPTIGATPSTQANKYFNAVLWTGNGSTPRAFSGIGFAPDFAWIKSRTTAADNALIDIVRGTGSKALVSNSTSAENGDGLVINSFDSDGYTLATGSFNFSYANTNTANYVAWNWKANGAGVTNTAGSITSTVSANTTAGFSIVTYTGTGANATVGHGLGVAPRMVIVKRRNGVVDWGVYHSSLASAANALYLNTTNAQFSAPTYWNSTAPSSTVFSLGTDAATNGNTNTYVAYCFAQVAGYSAFGSYTGNGSTDGPFVFCGFRPRFLLVKRTDVGGSWYIWDTSRNSASGGNVMGYQLYPNLANAESGSGTDFDFLSNGFKTRGSYTDINGNGGTYIYMAFAENPFKYSLAR